MCCCCWLVVVNSYLRLSRSCPSACSIWTSSPPPSSGLTVTAKIVSYTASLDLLKVGWISCWVHWRLWTPNCHRNAYWTSHQQRARWFCCSFDHLLLEIFGQISSLWLPTADWLPGLMTYCESFFPKVTTHMSNHLPTHTVHKLCLSTVFYYGNRNYYSIMWCGGSIYLWFNWWNDGVIFCRSHSQSVLLVLIVYCLKYCMYWIYLCWLIVLQGFGLIYSYCFD